MYFYCYKVKPWCYYCGNIIEVFLHINEVRNTEEVGLISPQTINWKTGFDYPPAGQVGIIILLLLRTRSSHKDKNAGTNLVRSMLSNSQNNYFSVLCTLIYTKGNLYAITALKAERFSIISIGNYENTLTIICIIPLYPSMDIRWVKKNLSLKLWVFIPKLMCSYVNSPMILWI